MDSRLLYLLLMTICIHILIIKKSNGLSNGASDQSNPLPPSWTSATWTTDPQQEQQQEQQQETQAPNQRQGDQFNEPHQIAFWPNSRKSTSHSRSSVWNNSNRNRSPRRSEMQDKQVHRQRISEQRPHSGAVNPRNLNDNHYSNRQFSNSINSDWQSPVDRRSSRTPNQRGPPASWRQDSQPDRHNELQIANAWKSTKSLWSDQTDQTNKNTGNRNGRPPRHDSRPPSTHREHLPRNNDNGNHGNNYRTASRNDVRNPPSRRNRPRNNYDTNNQPRFKGKSRHSQNSGRTRTTLPPVSRHHDQRPRKPSRTFEHKQFSRDNRQRPSDQGRHHFQPSPPTRSQYHDRPNRQQSFSKDNTRYRSKPNADRSYQPESRPRENSWNSQDYYSIDNTQRSHRLNIRNDNNHPPRKQRGRDLFSQPTTTRDNTQSPNRNRPIPETHTRPERRDRHFKRNVNDRNTHKSFSKDYDRQPHRMRDHTRNGQQHPTKQLLGIQNERPFKENNLQFPQQEISSRTEPLNKQRYPESVPVRNEINKNPRQVIPDNSNTATNFRRDQRDPTINTQQEYTADQQPGNRVSAKLPTKSNIIEPAQSIQAVNDKDTHINTQPPLATGPKAVIASESLQSSVSVTPIVYGQQSKQPEADYLSNPPEHKSQMMKTDQRVVDIPRNLDTPPFRQSLVGKSTVAQQDTSILNSETRSPFEDPINGVQTPMGIQKTMPDERLPRNLGIKQDSRPVLKTEAQYSKTSKPGKQTDINQSKIKQSTNILDSVQVTYSSTQSNSNNGGTNIRQQNQTGVDLYSRRPNNNHDSVEHNDHRNTRPNDLINGQESRRYNDSQINNTAISPQNRFSKNEEQRNPIQNRVYQQNPTNEHLLDTLLTNYNHKKNTDTQTEHTPRDIDRQTSRNFKERQTVTPQNEQPQHQSNTPNSSINIQEKDTLAPHNEQPQRQTSVPKSSSSFQERQTLIPRNKQPQGQTNTSMSSNSFQERQTSTSNKERTPLHQTDVSIPNRFTEMQEPTHHNGQRQTGQRQTQSGTSISNKERTPLHQTDVSIPNRFPGMREPTHHNGQRQTGQRQTQSGTSKSNHFQEKPSTMPNRDTHIEQQLTRDSNLREPASRERRINDRFIPTTETQNNSPQRNHDRYPPDTGSKYERNNGQKPLNTNGPQHRPRVQDQRTLNTHEVSRSPVHNLQTSSQFADRPNNYFPSEQSRRSSKQSQRIESGKPSSHVSHNQRQTNKQDNRVSIASSRSRQRSEDHRNDPQLPEPYRQLPPHQLLLRRGGNRNKLNEPPNSNQAGPNYPPNDFNNRRGENRNNFNEPPSSNQAGPNYPPNDFNNRRGENRNNFNEPPSSNQAGPNYPPNDFNNRRRGNRNNLNEPPNSNQAGENYPPNDFNNRRGGNRNNLNEPPNSNQAGPNYPPNDFNNRRTQPANLPSLSNRRPELDIHNSRNADSRTHDPSRGIPQSRETQPTRNSEIPSPPKNTNSDGQTYTQNRPNTYNPKPNLNQRGLIMRKETGATKDYAEPALSKYGVYHPDGSLTQEEYSMVLPHVQRLVSLHYNRSEQIYKIADYLVMDRFTLTFALRAGKDMCYVGLLNSGILNSFRRFVNNTKTAQRGEVDSNLRLFYFEEVEQLVYSDVNHTAGEYIAGSCGNAFIFRVRRITQPPIYLGNGTVVPGSACPFGSPLRSRATNDISSCPAGYCPSVVHKCNLQYSICCPDMPKTTNCVSLSIGQICILYSPNRVILD